jgi:hypothetical protein
MARKKARMPPGFLFQWIIQCKEDPGGRLESEKNRILGRASSLGHEFILLHSWTLGWVTFSKRILG